MAPRNLEIHAARFKVIRINIGNVIFHTIMGFLGLMYPKWLLFSAVQSLSKYFFCYTHIFPVLETSHWPTVDVSIPLPTRLIKPVWKQAILLLFSLTQQWTSVLVDVPDFSTWLQKSLSDVAVLSILVCSSAMLA